MTVDELKNNLYAVQSRIARAAEAAGSVVKLVAATKTVSAELVNAIVGLGVTDVGENRVQEYLAKRDVVTGAEWHFIGTLQRNKAKYLVGKVALIQSVSSVGLADEIERLADKLNVVQEVLVEVNAADEPSKAGADFGIADKLIERVKAMPHVRLRGVMSVPPRDADDAAYKRVARLYERYKDKSAGFDILSVGMSGDCERAIACGSNMVRIGTALFGARKTGG